MDKLKQEKNDEKFLTWLEKKGIEKNNLTKDEYTEAILTYVKNGK